MTTKEFSDQFDVLLTSYLRFKKFDDKEILDSIEINEYEKSIYLTKSQNNLVIELYSGRNILNSSYEQTEELRRYLSNLNTTEEIEVFTPVVGLSDDSVECVISDSLLFITHEQCKIQSDDVCIDDTWVGCTPIKRDEYNVIKDNPFKNKKVWRVDNTSNKVELISKHEIMAYKVSYIRKPVPIILEDITPYSIDGVTTVSESELPTSLHELILERAVQNALQDIASKFSSKEN